MFGRCGEGESSWVVGLAASRESPWKWVVVVLSVPPADGRTGEMISLDSKVMLGVRCVLAPFPAQLPLLPIAGSGVVVGGAVHFSRSQINSAIKLGGRMGAEFV